MTLSLYSTYERYGYMGKIILHIIQCVAAPFLYTYMCIGTLQELLQTLLQFIFFHLLKILKVLTSSYPLSHFLMSIRLQTKMPAISMGSFCCFFKKKELEKSIFSVVFFGFQVAVFDPNFDAFFHTYPQSTYVCV